MDKLTFNTLADDARLNICTGSLLKGINALEGMLTAIHGWEAMEQVRQVREAYNMMLSVLGKGVQDPDRMQHLCEFQRKLVLIMEAARHDYEVTESVNPSESPRHLFDFIRSSGQWTAADTENFLSFIASDNQCYEEKALIVSALTLAILRFFDPQKILLLCYLCRDLDERIRSRAQVGMALATMTQYDVVSLFPDVLSEVKSIVTDPSMRYELQQTQMLLYSALNTPEVSRRFEEEMNDLPEWIDREDEQGRKEIHRKFKIFIDLQGHGADLNMSSFNQMRRATNFFMTDANWFWPFTTNHPALKNITIPDAVHKLFRLGRHTETDKYALTLMLSAAHVHFEHEGGESDVMSELENLESIPDIDTELKHYIFDLYRFFTLRSPKEYPNPFTHNLLMLDYAVFQPLYTREDDLVSLIRMQIYSHAYAQALPLLEKVSTANPESSWALQQLGHCYEALEDYKSAYVYYSSVLAYNPDDMKAQMKVANILVKCERESEALPMLYKLHYRHPDDLMVQRILAWCLIKSGETTEALDYFAKLMAINSTEYTDYQNAGHAYLLMNNAAKALSCYRKALQVMSEYAPDKYQVEGHIDIYPAMFDSDDEWLMNRGVSPEVINLIADALSQDIENPNA